MFNRPHPLPPNQSAKHTPSPAAFSTQWTTALCVGDPYWTKGSLRGVELVTCLFYSLLWQDIWSRMCAPIVASMEAQTTEGYPRNSMRSEAERSRGAIVLGILLAIGRLVLGCTRAG